MQTFSHNPRDLVRLYEACVQRGRPVDRFALCDGSQCGQLADEPGVIVLFASKYVKIITGMKVHDATAGFVCYTGKYWKQSIWTRSVLKVMLSRSR